VQFSKLQYTCFLTNAGQYDTVEHHFAVDYVGGLLTTTETVDREQICPATSTGASEDCLIQLDVSVTPFNYFRVIRVRIHVEDINDNAPRFPVDAVTMSVYELAAVGARLPLPAAVDDDEPPNDVRQYSLEPRNGTATPIPFRLEQSPSAGDLYLVLAGEVDREVTSKYWLTLIAVDGGSPQHTATIAVSVDVLDANDHSPTFVKSLYEVDVREDAPLGTTVVRVSAVDADLGDNARVQYRRMEGRGGPSPFDVDRDTGDVVLAAPLDRERAAEHVIGVAASDSPSHGPPLSGYTRVVVRVLDANDHPPSLSVHSLLGLQQRLSVTENAPAGSFVAHLSVSDRDSGPNSLVSCQLTRGADAFQLIAFTGIAEYKLVSSRTLDREQQDMYTVVITCFVRIYTVVKRCPHWRHWRQLLFSATVAEFGDKLWPCRRCGQGFIR